MAVLTGRSTQREAADMSKVDRSTVTVICRTAKQGVLQALSTRAGPPGQSPKQVEIEELRAEYERLRAPSPSRRWRCTCTRKIVLGLTAGPVPPTTRKTRLPPGRRRSGFTRCWRF